MENRFWRKVFLFCIMIAVSFMLAACGDDDDDDTPATPASSDQPAEGDNGDNPPDGSGPEASAAMLDSYDFTMTIQNREPYLTLVQPIGENERTLVVSNRGGGSFTGTFDPAAGEIVLNGGSTFVLTTTNYWGNTTLESFPILVEEDLVFLEDSPGAQDNFPVEGSFSLRYVVNTVVVDFVSEAETPGVNMRINDEAPVFYSFDELYDLLDENVMVWQQKASLAYNVLEFLAEQAILAARTGDIIVGRAARLEENGSITFTCGTFPLDAAPDPSRTLTWLDADESGGIGSGDAFRWDFVSCWTDDVGTLIDDLMHGRVDLQGYVQDVQQRDDMDVLTRFGFEPEVQTTAGVTYTDVVQTEIEEETQGTLSINPKRTYVVNGGYNIIFSEPAAMEQ